MTLEQLIDENAELRQTIAEFGEVAREAVRLRELNADLQHQIVILQQQIYELSQVGGQEGTQE